MPSLGVAQRDGLAGQGAGACHGNVVGPGGLRAAGRPRTGAQHMGPIQGRPQTDRAARPRSLVLCLQAQRMLLMVVFSISIRLLGSGA
jgi:hypothetical protein